jgi:vacuole morphology and inheritance protein 14
LLTNSNDYSIAAAATSSNYDRPNRLKGREDGAIRWVELLEKFRSVQDRARRSQRHSIEIDDTFSAGVGEFRIGEASPDIKNRDGIRGGPPGPPVPLKDQVPAISSPPVKKSGLGRQFGRLGGAVSGKTRRNQ